MKHHIDLEHIVPAAFARGRVELLGGADPEYVCGGMQHARRSVLALTLASFACGAEIEGVPEGALARVGDVVIDPEQVEQTHAQLGAYGQARFRGPEGQRALLDALIVETLLVQEARDAGLAGDPRVHFAVLEELASLERAAMLERRLPRASVEADVEALRARYEAERTRFATPERRRFRGVAFDTWEQAEAALARLVAGEVELDALGPVVNSVPMKRDDLEYPGFHALLFDPGLRVGDRLAHPVISGTSVLVGELSAIEPAGVLEFDDAEVREQLVEREWAERVAPIEAELLAELAERFPVGAG